MNLAPLDLNSQMMRPWRTENVSPKAKNHIVSDASDQTIVYRIVAANSYRKEGWLGWSSLTYGGTAQYANTMALYFDWTMQLHRWFDFWTAWHLGLLAQVLVAAWGMLLFLQGRSIGPVWACCGALAYAANSQFVTWIYHRWALGSFCWVPWILWAIDSYRRGKRGYWPLTVILIGMAFLGGTIQHGVLVVLVVMAVWAEEAWTLGRCTAAQLRLLGRYAAWGLLGAGVAAMMFIPCMDALVTSLGLGLHTGMYGNSENGIYPKGIMQPLFNLAAYPLQILPSVLGRCDSVDALKLFKSELFYVAYFGSLPVIVAFTALWRKQTPLLARLLVWVGLLLPLTPLVRYLYQRLFLLFIFGGILAFAHLMENASRETRLRIFRFVGIATSLGIAAWTALSALLVAQPQLLSPLRTKILAESKGSSFGYFSDWMAGRADHFINDLFIWSSQQTLPLLLLCAALLGLRWTASLKDSQRTSGAWVVALAIVCEVSLFGSRWVVWTDPAKHPLFPETPETAAVEKHVGHNGRVTTLTHPSAHMACTPFIPNTLSPYAIATISGYDSIVPDGMILPNESEGDAVKLGRLGISHLVTWPGNPDVAPEWNLVWNSPSMDLYKNTVCVPRYIAFSSNILKESFFDGAESEFVQIREKLDLENRRLLEVPIGAPWIRIAENHDHGWEYRVASTDTWRAVSRAPDASMLIKNPQPAAATLIEMRYNPPLRRAGLTISGVSLLLTFLVWAGLLLMARRAARAAAN